VNQEERKEKRGNEWLKPVLVLPERKRADRITEDEREG